MEGGLSLWPVALAFLVVTVSPGPANVAVAGVALRAGRVQGLGLSIWGIVAATGIGALLQASAIALFAMKLIGGAYLLWLALGAARAARAAQVGSIAPHVVTRPFLRGLTLNLSNPKAVAAWMAALSMGFGAQGSTAMQVALATLVCALIGFANYAGHALIFSMPAPTAFYHRARRWVEGIMAALFTLAGFALIRSAFSR